MVIAAAPLALASIAELVACTVVSCVPPVVRALTVAPLSVARVDCEAMLTDALPDTLKPNFGCGLGSAGAEAAVAVAPDVGGAGSDIAGPALLAGNGLDIDGPATSACELPAIAGAAAAATGAPPEILAASLSSTPSSLMIFFDASSTFFLALSIVPLILSMTPGLPASAVGSSFFASEPATAIAIERPVVSALTASASVAMKPLAAVTTRSRPVTVLLSPLLSPT